MTIENLTATLAEKVMTWGIGPDRFLLGNRRWIPRWRFQPAVRLEEAFRLLEKLAPEEYTMGAAPNGGFWVKVRVAGVIGEATESSKARALKLGNLSGPRGRNRTSDRGRIWQEMAEFLRKPDSR